MPEPEHTPIIGQYFTLLATLIFLSLNGHLLLVATILSSYESIQHSARPSPEAWESLFIYWR